MTIKYRCFMKHGATVMLDGEVVQIPAAGLMAEVEDMFTPLPGALAGADVVLRERSASAVVLRDAAGQVVQRGLPEPEEGVVLIVNGLVIDALAGCGRSDVFAPDTGDTAERNDKGHVVFVRRLVAPQP